MSSAKQRSSKAHESTQPGGKRKKPAPVAEEPEESAAAAGANEDASQDGVEEAKSERRPKSSRKSRMDADAASEASAAAATASDTADVEEPSAAPVAPKSPVREVEQEVMLSQAPQSPPMPVVHRKSAAAASSTLNVPGAGAAAVGAGRGRSKSPAPKDPSAAAAQAKSAVAAAAPQVSSAAPAAASAAAAASGQFAAARQAAAAPVVGQFSRPAVSTQFTSKPAGAAAAAAAGAGRGGIEMGLVHIGDKPDMKLAKFDMKMANLNDALIPLPEEVPTSSWFELMDPAKFTQYQLGWRKTKTTKGDVNNFVPMDTRNRVPGGSFANVKLEFPHAILHWFSAPPYGNWEDSGEETKSEFPAKDVQIAKWSFSLSMRAYGDNSDANGCDPKFVRAIAVANAWNELYLRKAMVEDPEVKQWWDFYKKPLLAGARGKKWEDLCKESPTFEEDHIQNFLRTNCHWEMRKKNDHNPKLKDPWFADMPTDPYYSATVSGYVCTPEEFVHESAKKAEAQREVELYSNDTPANRRKITGLQTRRAFEKRINEALPEQNAKIEAYNKSQSDKTKHRKPKSLIRMATPRLYTFEKGVKREIEFHEYIGIMKKNDFVASVVVKLTPRKPSTPGAQGGVAMPPGLEFELVEGILSRDGLKLKRQETAALREPVGAVPFVPSWADGGMSREELEKILSRVAPDRALPAPQMHGAPASASASSRS